MPRSTLYEDFLAFTRGNVLLEPGDRVLAAVSGGPDSVALLDLLDRCRGSEGFELFVCHLDHGLRGEDSRLDAEFVRRLADDRGLRAEIAGRDVAALARESGASVEQAARRARYEFFAECAGRLDCSKVATAHTLSDNAETVLQRLIEGAGPAGISGVPLRRPLGRGVEVVRPLLFASREEVEGYLAARSLEWRLDRSNLEPVYLRNRLRLEVLPLLSKLNPSIERALARAGRSVEALLDYLRPEIEAARGRVVREETPRRAVLDRRALLAEHRALAAEVAKSLLHRLADDPSRISAAHVDGLLQLAASENPSAELALPGALSARREYEKIILEAGAAPGGQKPAGPPGREKDAAPRKDAGAPGNDAATSRKGAAGPPRKDSARDEGAADEAPSEGEEPTRREEGEQPRGRRPRPSPRGGPSPEEETPSVGERSVGGFVAPSTGQVFDPEAAGTDPLAQAMEKAFRDSPFLSEARFDKPLDVPGSFQLPGREGRVEARRVGDLDFEEFLAGKAPREEAVDAAAVRGSLRVRNARPGDSFTPLGAPGEKKLQDLFVDEKIPRFRRWYHPVVTDEEGIIWVCGIRIAERVKVRPQTREFLLLRWVKEVRRGE